MFRVPVLAGSGLPRKVRDGTLNRQRAPFPDRHVFFEAMHEFAEQRDAFRAMLGGDTEINRRFLRPAQCRRDESPLPPDTDAAQEMSSSRRRISRSAIFRVGFVFERGNICGVFFSHEPRREIPAMHPDAPLAGV